MLTSAAPAGPRVKIDDTTSVELSVPSGAIYGTPEGGATTMLAFPGCVGPLRYRDRGALDRDLANLKAAVAKSNPAEAFMTAASPGILTRFIVNLHYKTEDEYVAALAEASATASSP